MYQRKSGPIATNNLLKKQSKSNLQGQNQNQSQPKFILKIPSHLQSRPFSAIDHLDDSLSNPSYYEIYQQQKQQRQSSSSPDIYEHNSRSQANFGNQSFLQENENNQSSISMKLQQILQKQINNPRQNKSKTQNNSNSSFETLNNNQSRRPANSYHVFNSKPKSVDIYENEQIARDQINYHESQKNRRNEGPPTALKNTFLLNKNQFMSNEILTPNNQITFSNESIQMEELTNLSAENKKLISIQLKIQKDSIKKLNLDFQQQKSANNNLSNENQKLRDQINDQNNEMNNVLQLIKQEKSTMQQQIQQKDSLIYQLRQQMQYQEEQSKARKSNSTHQEIDDLKNRIMARKSTQRSSRDNVVSSQESRGRLINCDNILDEMDSSARLDIKSIRQQIAEDNKENQGRLANQNKKIFPFQENKFKLRK